MAEAPRHDDRPDGHGQHAELDAGTPRWVKLSAAIALALVLLVVAMLLLGGGSHGPGRHSGGGDGGAGTLTA